MKKHLLLAMLAAVTLCSQGCSKKDEPAAQAPASQMVQGTWRLAVMENNIPHTMGSPTIATPTTFVYGYKPGDVVVVWTATTAEEYIVGQSQGAVNYTLADSTLTTTTAKGVASTGRILILTKDKLRILKTITNPLADGPSPGSNIVIFNYIR
jgi:hypothetical protein